MEQFKKIGSYLLVFVLGGLVVWQMIRLYQMSENSTSVSHTIVYNLKKLNKLVVAEQNYSNIYQYKDATYLFDESFLSFDKKLTLLVNSRVQASYDLKKMQVEVDSVQQVIRILHVPDLQVETFSEVTFKDLEQSRLNQFDKDEINQIKQRAIAEVEKKIDMDSLRSNAHQQLLTNLEEIYVLAQFYGWKIEDKTPYAQELLKRIRF